MNEIKEIKVGDFVNILGSAGTFTVSVVDNRYKQVKLIANHHPFHTCIQWMSEVKVAVHQPKPKQDIDSQIKDILNNFDFERVHEVMKLLNWQWYSSNTEDKVPSYGELVMQAQSLLQQAVKGLSKEQGNYFSTGTGGFNAIAIRCDDGYIVVELQFNIAEGSNRE